MRSGINPGKVDYELPAFKRHRVIVPVYVPHQDGYFQHALEVLRFSLESLWRSGRGRLSITVISNGSVPEVDSLLDGYFQAGRLDQVVLNDHNWGKIDAVLAAAHGRFEPLITIADADVLFLPGWLEAVERIFTTFPEAGFVTPSPNPSLAFSHTTSTVLSALIRRELSFEKVVPERDLDLFADSIGRPDYFTRSHRQRQLTVARRGMRACVGGGHFVFTVRREVVERLPYEPVLAALGTGMRTRFDDPPDMMGVWRLSTSRAYVRHIGNTPEPWMYDELCPEPPADQPTGSSEMPLPALKRSHVRFIPFRWRERAISALRRSVFDRGIEPGRGWLRAALFSREV